MAGAGAAVLIHVKPHFYLPGKWIFGLNQLLGGGEKPFDLRQKAFSRGKHDAMQLGKDTEMKALLAAVAAAFLAAPIAAQAQDAAAAEALMKKSGCFKCHSVTAKKDGPSYKSVAEKYKGKADAEAALVKHITTGPMVKIDGKEERHEIIKSKDEKEIKNVVSFILSR